MRTPRLTLAIGTCGRCRKPLRLGRPHTCVTRLDRKPSASRTKIQPKIALRYGKCSTCHREITKWPHTCTVKTDFKSRKAEQEKQAKAAAKKRKRRNDHPAPSDCEDPDCNRYACVQCRIAWQKGYEVGHGAGAAAGHAAGYADGQADGQAEGYSSGFADGAASSD